MCCLIGVSAVYELQRYDFLFGEQQILQAIAVTTLSLLGNLADFAVNSSNGGFVFVFFHWPLEVTGI